MTEKITTESGVVLDVQKSLIDKRIEVSIVMEGDRNCLLHWGLRDYFSPQWKQPPESLWPPGTEPFDKSAVRSPLRREDGRGRITITFEVPPELPLIAFVLYFPDGRRWDNNRGRNYQIELPADERSPDPGAVLGSPRLAGIAAAIIEQEMSRNSWTLMHRFNLCYDLLDKVGAGDADGLALLFVWLRYSFLRQLDWQRNYNTKPRELGHAMDRLTLKVARRYANQPADRGLLRLIMTTLGPGGDAQRVRDEILHIMHRHHIKEVSGHFMEEWHQKLHNNATPDDVVICEAFIEFYRSGGDLGRFYRRLEEGGLSKERLESYERPIRSHPDFIPYLKDALIGDFEHFLGILKEVHAGTDLGIAIHRCRRHFDQGMHGLMDFLWSNRNRTDLTVTLAWKITEARRGLANRLTGDEGTVRDLLFLDLALEEFLRTLVERGLSAQPGDRELSEIVSAVLENLCLSECDAEFRLCLSQWNQTLNLAPRDTVTALRVRAALERLQEVLASQTDSLYQILQPKAESLGKAFHAAPWTVGLFSEEVLRGRPAFALSALLKRIEGLNRAAAGLGSWQVISPGEAAGEILQVVSLAEIQARSFERPVIVIAAKVLGNEEIPRRVTGIITPSSVDVLSHLAIRARNSGVLFAVCYDAQELARVEALRGNYRAFTGPSGGVTFQEGAGSPSALPAAARGSSVLSPLPPFRSYALAVAEFNEQYVGGKSNNLGRLRQRLPDWISLPASVALPFGVFEKVLRSEANRAVDTEYGDLCRSLDGEPEKLDLLAGLREVILKMQAPPELLAALRSSMKDAGLPCSQDWDEAWRCVKQVWASKWNERAYLSRRSNGIPHDALLMAVLVQAVVEAEYSFVIHTANPVTGSRDEIYAEVVLGLGEALVGNYPGKALSFTCRKGRDEPRVLSFPSKSVGLFGSGLIFRSDSNGEDLTGFAGAGLYDSFITPTPERRPLDYTTSRLIDDGTFRRNLLIKLAAIGKAVEQAAGYPQDIEGAYAQGRFHVVQTRPQVGLERR